MGLAEDKVYTHITRNLRKFGTIRVASLANSLTCLVDSDRDELLAREETRGNQAAVFRFYQHLRCRKGWVQDLIQALHQNNAGHLADELQEVYDTWQLRPRSSAPAAPSSLPSDAHPTVSSISAQTPSWGPNSAPLAGQPRRDPATGDHPPVLPSAATPTSTDLEARLPVQESLPKKLPEQETPRPVPAGSKVPGGASGGHSGEENLSRPAGAVPVPAGTPGVAVPPAVSPEQGRDWLSRRPVCVDNGFFGNANHLHRGAPGLALGRSVPSRDAGATHSPGQPRNEPEESSDVSTESLPRLEGATHGVGRQPPNSVPKKQPVPISGHGEPTGSFVDVRSPLFTREQLDVEKKRVGMLPEHPGSGGASMETTTVAATPVPRDTFPSRDTSVKSLTQEKKLPIGNTASSTPSVPTKEKVLPASANPVLGTAVVGGSEGVARRSASRVSSATSIWVSHSDEEREEELSKPGVLMSTPQGSPEVIGRCPSSREPSNHRSTTSSSLGLSSDPVLVSRDSLSSGAALPRVSSVPAGPREKEAFGARRDSCPAPSWDSSSLDTHELRVDHHPSVQLGAGNDGVSPLGSSVNSSSGSGRDAATSSPQARVPKGDSNGLSLLYILPAIGVISAVAFAVYARLRK
ncbi:mitochondrial antiviral-signaling protein isoform X1 [Onychostruthus taczanowskii]|uniref:mitochondrial antiviral-signaling protein isoform X1 n=1 Tax=Onychostruthus taczanowskii TaxID=356909 RepID=UPI001B80BA3F|nr:mitochondrial antiviral-signaling protein isoform X1 [Onychostruthus taczanowskii]XP_041258851.1 mitochondrial antiviral-signaling protein isoform X1 [Onychostruthus taczanowskii]XP_041258852.1 mitochondrial antiviral-signaling protein isoform X1 [Onychostruthus taczanowskii]